MNKDETDLYLNVIYLISIITIGILVGFKVGWELGLSISLFTSIIIISINRK